MLVYKPFSFSVCRFLHEDPWERLEALRAKVPNVPFQVSSLAAKVQECALLVLQLLHSTR